MTEYISLVLHMLKTLIPMNSSWLAYLPTFIQKRLEGRQTLQRVINNSGWMFFDKVFRMGVGFLVAVWVTRYLGPEQFGLLSYSTAFVSLFAAVANLGLYGIVVRDIVRHPENREEIIGTALFLKCIGGFFCLLLSLAVIFLVRHGDSQVHWLVGIIAAGMIFQSLDVFDFWFQSQLQSKYTSFANIPGFVAMTIVRITLIISGASLVAFAWAAFFDLLLAGVGLLSAYQLATRRLGSLRVNRKLAGRLLSDSWPVIFAGLMLMVYSRIDQVMIGQMLDEKSVGFYAAAVKLAELWYFFPTLILNSMLGMIVAAKEEGENIYYHRLQQVFDVMAIVSYLFILPLALFSGKIMVFMYGDAYASAAPVLTVYVVSGIFVFLGHTREYWVTVENITRFSMYSTAVGAILNILLNFVLIPVYGNLGAAYATLVSLVMAGYLVNAFHGKTRRIFGLQTRALFLVSLFTRLKRA